LKFLLDENVPISIKDVIHDLGFEVFTLHDFDKLGIQNGEVSKLTLQEKAIIIDSDFLQLNQILQEKSYIYIYLKIHPRDPKFLNHIINVY